MATMAAKAVKLPVEVNKPTPYTFDLGLLLASDPNPVLLTSPENLEDDLAATARDGAQALLNQLLSTCPIASTPNGVLLSLPEIETRLPREKPLPPPKAQTTWEKFAAKKGIKAKSAEQRKKMVYDDATGEWVPKWGYKGANKAGENDWIVEVDMKKEAERKEGTERQGDGRRERKEKVRRNERLQRANDRKGRKNGAK
ncbi:ribosome biogenesis regulatory protein [Drepanopeziza brunnea f. sp. 'multigermtubi' MB_m1]|uniref:Ribosome biogenesis regulatory protein n=1 Tax=Marssonina brunnea f. sp. multigermtubi (strain MB_m1) TaxID=1072389 RepID=K1WR75_MARBU|nr:ribosome biogenesis regulatory protein [Drepanopeziza brunnea f. sp. 'multigermtubi' MB_m1]EKD15531.1 ribosome biogenesis regulatory protein [Drepanopeziza brunnea f. sp. 'multigermtubi' MB_m1]